MNYLYIEFLIYQVNKEQEEQEIRKAPNLKLAINFRPFFTSKLFFKPETG